VIYDLSWFYTFSRYLFLLKTCFIFHVVLNIKYFLHVSLSSPNSNSLYYCKHTMFHYDWIVLLLTSEHCENHWAWCNSKRVSGHGKHTWDYKFFFFFFFWTTILWLNKYNVLIKLVQLLVKFIFEPIWQLQHIQALPNH